MSVDKPGVSRGRGMVWGPSGVGLVGAGVFVGALALYVRTAAPSVLGADSGEFQFVPPVLGIAHPPGYALYTLLGKVFSLLPLGDAAYRLNLMSGFFGAAAVGLVYAATLLLNNRAPGGRHWAAFGGVVAALAVGLAPTWWSQATVAAVRTL